MAGLTRGTVRMTLTSGARLGPYEVLSPVNAGGMGEIYKARDIRLDRTVAIKILPADHANDPHARDRFDREARAIAHLTHPHICTLHDVGREHGTDFLVMEYLEGETLAQRLERGALPVAESLRLALEILHALEHAHAQGIYHCDLKPSNILLTRSGTKLLDFGIAQIQQREAVRASRDHERPGETLSLAAEDAVFGTVHYMAPERVDGQPASAAADLFAFGAVLYEMVTGRKAFGGRDRGETLAAVLTDEPVVASELCTDVSPTLDRVIVRCLAKVPENRWQSAHDLRLELHWVAEHGGLTTTSPRSVGRLTARWAAGLVLGVALIALTIVLAARSFGPTPGDRGPMRFVVAAPEETTFSTAGKWLDVSPDGRWLVFVALRKNGQSQLWLRALDSTTARLLPGTEGAGSPFWSPDSRFLGFEANGQLKKIDVFGGTPQTLSENVAPRGVRGGTWSREGVILFAPGYLRGGLFRVSAAGGQPTPATQLDAAREEVLHTWPQFLPDGRRFLYRTWSPKTGSTGVYLGSLDTPNLHVQINGVDSNPMYAAGYVLFGREGTLFAQAFDARHTRVEGEPILIAEQVLQNPASGQMSAATSEAGILAYRGLGLQQLVWVDRSGRVLGEVGPPGVYKDPAISPTADRVAVSRLDPRTGTEDIWMIDVVRGTAARLTSDPARDTAPLFSPDGRHIVFSSNRGQAITSQLYQKALEDAQAEERLSTVSVSRATDWSRDGRLVIVDVAEPNTHWQVSVLTVTGDRDPVTLTRTAFNESRGKLSPDGRWIAYESDDSGTVEVYVRPYPAGGEKWQVSQRGGTEPTWRGDGHELFYVTPDGTLQAVTVRTAAGFATDPPRPLFTSTDLRGPMTSPIGRNRYDVTTDGQRFLLIQPVAGTASSPITVVANWTTALHE
jgi:Tol biopolymer transport system component